MKREMIRFACLSFEEAIFCIYLLFSHETFYTQAKVKKCNFFAVFCFINFLLRFKLNHFAGKIKLPIFAYFRK